MDITKEITKEVFERYVPVAKMPERNTSVFGRMKPYFMEAYSALRDHVFGEDFGSSMENDDFREDVLRAVCLKAFCAAIPSLDLVLTATGFGIVNTTDTAPASAQRVQALKDEMEWEALTAIDALVQRLTQTEGWGQTEVARKTMEHLYCRPAYIYEYGPFDTAKAPAENWRSAVSYRHTAESMIRREVSTEYYLVLLDKLRNGSMTNADRIVYGRCLETVSSIMRSCAGGQKMPTGQLQEIRDYMEKYIGEFPAYQGSELYAQLHGTHYENKQQDTSFFFV